MKRNKHLNIISFDIPYPADYGGVIDVFYQIRTLFRAGIKIHLHCFQYGGKIPHPELNKYCVSVRYYKRKTGLLSFFSNQPYIVKSRLSRKLEKRLLRNKFPILCQGIHSSGIILNPKFAKRNIIVRAGNVEHKYYHALAEKETSFLKRFYYKSEAKKLELWEKKLTSVNSIVTISNEDYQYFSSEFPDKKVIRAYGFNAVDEISGAVGKGGYALFHANLTVPENIDIAEIIIEKIAPITDYQFVIAGKSPSQDLLSKALSQKNVKIIGSPSEFKMQTLIEDAHIHLMLTRQATGFKLKLITSLFEGRYVIANDEMLQGSGLENCVIVSNTVEDIMSNIHKYMKLSFSEEELEKRKSCISKDYYNYKKAEDIIALL